MHLRIINISYDYAEKYFNLRAILIKINEIGFTPIRIGRTCAIH